MPAPATALPPRRFSAALARAALALACSALACSTPAPSTPTAAPPPALHEGPLSDYVPSAGLRWLLLASPRAIAREPGLLPARAPLLPESGFQGFSTRNGFDLRETSSALVAGFDLGTLYMVSADGSDASATTAFEERLLASSTVHHPHPRLTRVVGVAGTSPQALLRAENQLVAVATSDPALARVVEGYLLGRFKKTPVALRGAALTSLATFGDNAPLRAFFPGPFDEQAVPGPLRSTLLAGATAAALAVSFRDVAADAKTESGASSSPPLVLHIELVLAGDWSADDEAAARMQAAWEALSNTGPGRWFGLHRPVTAPEVQRSANFLRLRVDLDGNVVFRALRDAANAELHELFADPPSDENRSKPADEAPPVRPVSQF